MKKILLLLICIPALVFAADPYKDIAKKLSDDAGKKLKTKTVAVLPFEAIGVDVQLARVAADQLTHELVTLGDCSVLERARIDQVMKEQALSRSGAVKQDETLSIGKLLSVEGIITGSVAKRGKDIYLTARLIKTENGIILSSTEVALGNEEIRSPDDTGITTADKSQTDRNQPVFTKNATGSVVRKIEDDAEPSARLQDVQMVRYNKTVYFIGRVNNTGSVAVAQPRISIRLLDAGGKMLGVVDAFCERQVEPGEVLPFSGITMSLPAQYKRYEVVYQPQKVSFFSYLTNFKSSDESFKSDAIGNWQLAGMVNNPNSFNVKFIKIIVVLFDEKGAYIGSASGFSSIQKVNAGQSVPYTCSISKISLSGKPKSYTLFFSAMQD
jgi:TolB-like protein